MYRPTPGDGLSEVVCGQWYSETYNLRIAGNATYLDPATNIEYSNWLLPVIFYNDKMGVSAMEGSYSLEPLLFTLGVIRRTYRENEDSWRHLGFIPAPFLTKEKKKGIGAANMVPVLSLL